MILVRRWAFILFVAVAAGAATWAYYYLRQARPPSERALWTIPAGCAVYASFESIHALDIQLNSQSLVADRLRSYRGVRAILDPLHALDSALSSHPELLAEVVGSSMHYALYPPNDKRQIAWLLCCNIRSLGREREVRDALTSILHAGRDGRFSLVKHDAYFQLRNGVLSISDSPQLLDEAADADKYFFETGGYRTFADLLSPDGEPSIYLEHGLLKNAIGSPVPAIGNVFLSGRSAARMFSTPSEMRLCGILAGDTGVIVSRVARVLPLHRDTLLQYLPASVTAFTAIALDKLSDVIADDTAFWSLVSSRAMYNAKKELGEIAGKALCGMECGSTHVAALTVTDTAHARTLLTAMADTVKGKGAFAVYRLSERSPRLFFPSVDAAGSYAVLSADAIFFADDPSLLASLAFDLQSGRSLGAEKSFASYAVQQIPARFGYLVYADPSRTKVPALFSDSSASGIQANFRHLMFALSHENDGINYRLQLQYQARGEQPSLSADGWLWTHMLDTVAAASPDLFVNHQTGEKEIIISDRSNGLYLIDAKGRRLWKKRLQEQPVTPIYRVDALRNGKLQILFASAGYLHLIDRKGNYLPGYPLKLAARPTTPLTIVDYDGKRDYRIFLGCADRRIYCFSLNGEKPEGFIPAETSSEVHLPVTHARAGGSDYLIAIDSEGKIYCLNRKGAQRLALTNRATVDCDAFHVAPGKNADDTYIYYVDRKGGTLHRISLSDKKELINIGHHNEILHSAFVDVNGDKRTDLLAVDANSLWAYELSGTQLWHNKIGSGITDAGVFSSKSKPIVYGFSSPLSVVRTSEVETGHEYAHRATTSCLLVNLFADNKPYLVFADGRQLICTQP